MKWPHWLVARLNRVYRVTLKARPKALERAFMLRLSSRSCGAGSGGAPLVFVVAPRWAQALSQSGALCAHYWVEVNTPDGEVFVVDLTADQFGYEPVVVMQLAEASKRYLPGPQRQVDEALVELALELGCRDLLFV